MMIGYYIGIGSDGTGRGLPGGGDTQALTYVDIPSRDTLVNPTTVTYSGGTLTNASLTGNHGLISGEWLIITNNALIGTEGAEKIISNLDGNTVVGGLTPANHAVRTLNSSTRFKYQGKSPSEPFLLYRTIGAANNSENGFQVSGTALPGTFVWAQNMVAKEMNFACYFMNSGGTLSGGDASTVPASTLNYGYVELKFIRAFGKATEGEGLYLGSTSKTAYGIHHECLVEHFVVTDKGRDGIQFNNHLDLTVRNGVVYDVGKLDTDSQNNFIQVQNAKAIIENVIFDTCPSLCDISSLDVVFRNCYFRWDNGDAGLITDYYGAYNTASRLMVTPVKILFENCIFDPSVATTNLMDVRESNADVEFLNCVFSTNITNLFLDNRSAPVNSLIGDLTTNGNTHVASITRPAFTNFDPDDYENHGLLTTQEYYNRSMGFRTPPILIYEDDEVVRYEDNEVVEYE